MNLPDNMESHYVRVHGQWMHYVASTIPVDPNPAVVMVHGVGLSHRYLMPAAKWMANEYRLYVPDQPGFGKSFKPRHILTIPELADSFIPWMDAIGLERAAFLGNSVGCQIIVELAVRHPERITRAILQGPTVDPQARTFPRQMWRWYQNRKGERSSDKGPIVTQDYWECGVQRLVRTFRHALDQDLVEKLPHVHCPALVVRGSLDPIVPQRWAEEVVRLLPQGRLIVLPGTPHTANLETPLELYRVVRPFLNEERQTRARETPTHQPAAARAG